MPTGPAVLVLQHHAPAHAHALLGRVKLDVERDRSDLGLRFGGHRLVAFFVVGLAALGGERRFVMIEDVGVVEDVATDRHQAGRRGNAQGGSWQRQARARLPQALAPRACGAARPHQVCGHEQEERAGRPVGLEGAYAGQEVAVAIHVGVDRVRHAAELVEVVLQTELAREQQHEVVHDHHEMAEVLLPDDAVHGDRQRADEPVAGQVDGEELEQVQTGLEVRVALGRLDGHAAQHEHDLEHHRHQHQRDQLAHERQPGRRGQGVADLVDSVVALAPDQLAGVERDDDQQ